MDNYLITTFEAKHANYILSHGEIENYSKWFDVTTLEHQDSWTGHYKGEPIVSGGIYQMWEGVAEVWIIMRQGSNAKHKFFILYSFAIFFVSLKTTSSVTAWIEAAISI